MLTGSEVALLAAAVALTGTIATVIQKRITDRRDAWWGRTQWALEHILADQSSDDTERMVGILVLTALQGSRLATVEERKLIEQVADALSRQLLPEGQTDARSHIAAARLKMAIAERDGKKVPDPVRRVAKLPLQERLTPAQREMLDEIRRYPESPPADSPVGPGFTG